MYGQGWNYMPFKMAGHHNILTTRLEKKKLKGQVSSQVRVNFLRNGRYGQNNRQSQLQQMTLPYMLSHNTRFPTMWYVHPAKAQISLHKWAVWSEPLPVAWIFYDWTSFGVSKLKKKLHRLVWVYTCQNATLLEISLCGSIVIVQNEISNMMLKNIKCSETESTSFQSSKGKFSEKIGLNGQNRLIL